MQGKTALVVVARSGPRQTIARALARVGWQVSVATSGPDAVVVARAFLPDLVVVDADLDRFEDGLHPAVALRRAFVDGLPPRLVLVTAQQDDATMQLAVEADASRVVVVPSEHEAPNAGSGLIATPSDDSVPSFEDLTLPLSTRSLWVVDDSQATRVLVRRVFERSGWSVREFPDLGSAHGHAETHEAPDAMVLDIHLPDGNGLDHVRRFATSGAAVVMISNLAGPDQVERAFAAGAADVVSKPFDLRSLVARVERAVRMTPAHVVTSDVIPTPLLHSTAIEPAVFVTNWG